MIAHIPIFLLLTPLLSALAISIVKLFTKTNIFIKIITGIGTILPFYFLILIFHKLSDGIIEYNIGGWSTPFTITLIIDGFSFTMLLITSIIIFLSYIYSLGYLKKTDGKFYFFFLIMIVGLYGIFLSGDIFNLYVFFELTVISSYILITFGDKKLH